MQQGNHGLVVSRIPLGLKAYRERGRAEVGAGFAGSEVNASRLAVSAAEYSVNWRLDEQRQVGQ